MKTLFFSLIFSFSSLYALVLNDRDKKALVEYTGARFRNLNHSLRQGKGVPPADKVFYQDLITVLQKIPPYVGITFRGGKLDKSLIMHVKNKGYLSDEGFLSTTLDRGVGMGYSFEEETFYEIKSLTGKPIMDYSTFPDEKELVFLPFSVFKASFKGKIKVRNPLFSTSPNAPTKEVDHVELIEQARWPNAVVRSLSNGRVLTKPMK
jgi:hypothetical protein